MLVHSSSIDLTGRTLRFLTGQLAAPATTQSSATCASHDRQPLRTVEHTGERDRRGIRRVVAERGGAHQAQSQSSQTMTACPA